MCECGSWGWEVEGLGSGGKYGTPERVSSFISYWRSGLPILWDILMAEPCWN